MNKYLKIALCAACSFNAFATEYLSGSERTYAYILNMKINSFDAVSTCNPGPMPETVFQNTLHSFFVLNPLKEEEVRSNISAQCQNSPAYCAIKIQVDMDYFRFIKNITVSNITVPGKRLTCY